MTDSDTATAERSARFGVWEVAALLLILVLAALLRFYCLGRAPLWLDEQCQVYVASRPSMGAVWDETRVSGPIGRASYLDSALAWRMGAQTRAAFRLPQVLEGLAGVLLLYLVGRRWFTARVGLIAAALLACSGLHIFYSREARGYALFVLLFLWVGMAFDALVRKPGRWRAAALAGATFAALSVHPLAAVAAAGLACGALLAVAVRARPLPETRWLSAGLWAGGAMCCGAAAWYMICVRGMSMGSPGAEQQPHSFLYDVVDVYKALIGGYWGAGSYAIAAAWLVSLWAAARRAEWRWPLCLCLGVSVAATGPIILSHAMHSFAVPRYSCFAMPFLFLAAAAGLDALLDVCGSRSRGKLSAWQALIAPLLALALLGTMVLQGRSPYDLEKSKTTHPGWPTLAE